MSTNVLNTGATQLQSSEDDMNASYAENMSADNLGSLDLRSMQLLSYLVNIKANLETNMCKLLADICKAVVRNIVP